MMETKRDQYFIQMLKDVKVNYFENKMGGVVNPSDKEKLEEPVTT